MEQKEKAKRQNTDKRLVAIIVLCVVIIAAVFVIRNHSGGGSNTDPPQPVNNTSNSEGSGEPESSEGNKLPEDDSLSFVFDLSSGGEHNMTASGGDTVTVEYRLFRADEDSSFMIHAVQNEIEFDTDVFELVEDGISCSYTVSTHDYGNGKTRIYMNTFSAVPDGFEYEQGGLFGAIVLKVKEDAPAGTYIISSENYKMSTSTGMAFYSSSSEDLNVEIISKQRGTE